MNPLRSLCLMACLLAAVCATTGQRFGSAKNSLKASEWLPVSDLQSIPSIEDITLQTLENMSAEKGAKLVDKLYHLSQIDHQLTPSFVPSPSNIPTYIVKANGEKISSNLNNFVGAAKQQQNFGDEEVTVFITGLPQQSRSVTKANRKLVQAYIQRYNGQRQEQTKDKDYDYSNNARTSSEEDFNEAWNSESQKPQGNLVIIDLGSTLTSFKRCAMLDIDQTGAMIGKALVQMTEEAEVPHEILHIVAQGIAAHVAGAAARQYTRLTGHQVRRITALDPSKILAKNPNRLTGLARGDADFVDAIHTSAYGMGTADRVGDVDFFPNGPSVAVNGADNVVEASMRATRYFAETLRRGNERNFPAVAANSLQEYKNNNGNGKRAYMGIATEFDVEGDYMLQVNAKSPFGTRSPAQKQSTYHGNHQGWKNVNAHDD